MKAKGASERPKPRVRGCSRIRERERLNRKRAVNVPNFSWWELWGVGRLTKPIKEAEAEWYRGPPLHGRRLRYPTASNRIVTLGVLLGVLHSRSVAIR